MKAALFAIGGILSGWLLKFLKFLGGVVLRGLGTILSFFGLYVPVIYLLFGLVLNIAFKFNPFGGDVNGKLYVLGLVECLICTVIICVRNLVARPIQSVFAFLKGHSSGRSGGATRRKRRKFTAVRCGRTLSFTNTATVTTFSRTKTADFDFCERSINDGKIKTCES